MRTTRQDYKDSTFEKALQENCDIIQLKYDGWWGRIEFDGGLVQAFSRTGRLLEAFSGTHPLKDFKATIICELMYGTQWAQQENLKNKVFVFDIWHLSGTDLEAVPYKTRYDILKTAFPYLPKHFVRVPNFPIQDYDKIWKMYVESGDFEGVVFRGRNDQVGRPIYRQKSTVEVEATATDFEIGIGKYSQTLGAVVCQLPDKTTFKVGGGFTDEERDEIWANRERYVNHKMLVEGRKQFESGSIRHPNFVKWIKASHLT